MDYLLRKLNRILKDIYFCQSQSQHWCYMTNTVIFGSHAEWDGGTCYIVHSETIELTSISVQKLLSLELKKILYAKDMYYVQL